MQIQSTPSINFEARKVLNVTQKIKGSLNENTYDVFKLDSNNPSDIEFVKACYKNIKEFSSKSKPSKNSLEYFLKSFLDDLKSNTEEFYIAFKNNEKIVGGYNTFQFVADNVLNNVFYNKKQEKIVSDSLFYSLLNETKTLKSDKIYSANISDIFNQNSNVISKNDFFKITNEIKKKNPETRFSLKDKKEYDLFEFIGINGNEKFEIF